MYSPRTRAERAVTLHQRFVERVTAWLGRPATLYGVFLLVLGWIGFNGSLPAVGVRAPDPPPYFFLQGLVTLGALLLTVTVLITQNRQLKLSEKRSRLDLEINLTSERKVAKLIQLVEELRRDLPEVRNRTDSEADAMQQRANPHAIADQLDQRIEAEVSAEADRPPRPNPAPGK